MATGHVFMAMSLDGFVARKNHKLDWLMKQKTQGEEHGYTEFQASVNGIVMGRGSYENVLSFWARPYEKPVVVMSKALGPADIPEALREQVRISTLEPKRLMDELHAEGWSHAFIDGGKVFSLLSERG